MSFAIQLFFDPASDAAVQSLWEEVANTGTPFPQRDSGNRPHISLAIYAELDIPACASLLTSFARMVPPLALSIGSLGIFHGEKTVVFLAPVVTPGLLTLHRQVHQLLHHTGAFPAPNYLPGHWTPHCALATRVPSPFLSSIVEIGLGMSFPFHASLEEVGVITYPPVEHLFAFRLTGGETGIKSDV